MVRFCCYTFNTCGCRLFVPLCVPASGWRGGRRESGEAVYHRTMPTTWRDFCLCILPIVILKILMENSMKEEKAA